MKRQNERLREHHLPALSTWISGVFGSEIRIMASEWDEDDDPHVAAWVTRQDRQLAAEGLPAMVHFNRPVFHWRTTVLWSKAYLLHECGHLATRREIPHGVGSAEFAAHAWAMSKCCRLGLERELRVLRRQAAAWAGREKTTWRNPDDRKFIIAGRMLRNVSAF